MKIQKKVPNIAIEAYLLTIKWCLLFVFGIILVFGGLFWHLHNKTFSTGSQAIDIVQDGYGTNNNISNNEF